MCVSIPLEFFIVKIYDKLMSYIFRPYRHSDKKNCARIIAPTWRFDMYFPGTKNTDVLNAFVIDWFRLHSDYTDTAVREDGDSRDTCAAFLFAEIKSAGLPGLCRAVQKKLLFFFFYLRIFVLWLFGFYGKRGSVRKAFREYRAVQKKLFKDVMYDAEILCLFVDEKVQRRGLAKSLLMRFFQWADKRDLKSFVLATDTDCNYKFYDKGGFTRLKEMSGCLGVPQAAYGKSRIFLYGIYLEGNA